MQKKFLITVCLILGIVSIFAYLYPRENEDIPTRILLENIGGRVVFDHKTHYEDYGIDCTGCHHESSNTDLGVAECGACHGSLKSLGKPYPENMENVAKTEGNLKTPINSDAPYHNPNIIKDKNACLTCHHLEFVQKDWGHDIHVEDLGLSCNSCHHEDTDIEPEPMNCNNCHDADTTVNLRDAVHTKCMTCHEDLYDEGINTCTTCHGTIQTKKVYKGTGSISLDPKYMSCAVCHENIKPDELVPNRMLAFHGQCMGCHESMGAGPYGKNECAKCHIP